MRRWPLIATAAALLLGGCSTATETGYQPRRLGDSPTVQRGYYATDFSPEKKAANQDKGPAIDLGGNRGAAGPRN